MDLNEQHQPKEVALDSEDMDPNEVLFGGNDICVKVPVPNAKIFNNLAEYYSKTFAKKNEKKAEENLNKQLDAAADTCSRFTNFQHLIDKSMNEGECEEDSGKRRRKPSRSAPKSVIDKMHETQGPLSVLYRSMSQQVRIFVRRRKTCSLKEERFSWITGQLVAFDKHLNMALQNACEEYLHQEKCSKQSIRIRKCTAQMLVRGDNIVLVSHHSIL